MSQSTPPAPRRYLPRAFQFILTDPEFAPVTDAPLTALTTTDSPTAAPLTVEGTFYNVAPPQAMQLRLDVEGRHRRGAAEWVPYTDLAEMVAQLRWSSATVQSFHARLNALEPLNINSPYPHVQTTTRQ